MSVLTNVDSVYESKIEIYEDMRYPSIGQCTKRRKEKQIKQRLEIYWSIPFSIYLKILRVININSALITINFILLLRNLLFS